MNASSGKKQRKYLIAIGSPYCPNIEPSSLTKVESDIQRVNNLFTSKTQGYESVLTEISLGTTSTEIKDKLCFWFSSDERKASDQVIIYYAGHGVDGQESGSHYLYTIESKNDNLDKTAIETSSLAKCLFPGKANSPQNILLILDVCYAGVGVNNTLASSLTQCRKATENVSFWIIASAHSTTEAGDGDFVDALEKAMKDDNWNLKNQDKFIKPDELIGCINKHFTINQIPQQAEISSLNISSSPTFIQNPFFISQNALETGEHNLNQDFPKIKSDHPKIAELLWLLDYSAQEQDFKNVINNCKKGVFLVQTKPEKVQRWLVGRLARCVPDFQRAKKFSIRIRSHPMRSEFNEFWQEFEGVLGNNLNREMVIKGLAEAFKTTSVIIVIYGISSLNKAKVQELYDFWSDLVQVLSTSTQKPFFRSRLVLIVAENSSIELDKLHPFKFIQPPSINEDLYSISLTPLDKIVQQDVENWLAQDNVYKSLCQNEDELQSIVCNDIPNWTEEPLDVLEEICQTVFQIEDGITTIENYWKLA